MKTQEKTRINLLRMVAPCSVVTPDIRSTAFQGGGTKSKRLFFGIRSMGRRQRRQKLWKWIINIGIQNILNISGKIDEINKHRMVFSVVISSSWRPASSFSWVSSQAFEISKKIFGGPETPVFHIVCYGNIQCSYHNRIFINPFRLELTYFQSSFCSYFLLNTYIQVFRDESCKDSPKSHVLILQDRHVKYRVFQ